MSYNSYETLCKYSQNNSNNHQFVLKNANYYVIQLIKTGKFSWFGFIYDNSLNCLEPVAAGLLFVLEDFGRIEGGNMRMPTQCDEKSGGRVSELPTFWEKLPRSPSFKICFYINK